MWDENIKRKLLNYEYFKPDCEVIERKWVCQQSNFGYLLIQCL
jgi:hypothetical protein